MDVHLLGCRDYFGWLEMDKAFDRTEIESPFVVFEGGVIVELASDESVGFRVGRDLTGSCFQADQSVGRTDPLRFRFRQVGCGKQHCSAYRF